MRRGLWVLFNWVAVFVSIFVIGIGVSSVVQSVRKVGGRKQSGLNLQQIGRAMGCYHDQYASFPARAIFDKDGRAILSWRVAILPYLNQRELFLQFHLDEPWDSAHNRKLIPLMPSVYRNPSSEAQTGFSDYLAVCGKGLMFDGTKGHSLSDVADKKDETIIVVEANSDRAVTWTKPDDWEYDAANPLDGLGTAHPQDSTARPEGFNVLCADGTAHFVGTDINPTVFHRLLTIAGNDPPVGGY